MVTSDPSQQQSEAPAGDRGASYRAGFFFGTLSFLVTAAIGFVSTVITSRLYGVRVIGEYALVWAPVAALWILSTIKEQQALIKEITGLPRRHPRVTQLFAAVFTFSWALTTAVATLDAVACWFVFPGPLHAPELLAPALVSIAGYVVITNTGWNIDSIFSAFVAGRQLFWVNLHQAVSFIAIATGAGMIWHSVWGLVIAGVGSSLSALIHRVVAARPFVRARLTWDEYRAGLGVLPGLLRFGLKASPGQIAQGASQQGGVWAVGMVASVPIVGAYSRALVIPRSLQQASMRITQVLYPTLVGRHKQDDGHGFDRALIDSIRYQMIGMLMIAAGIGGAAHSILDIFGPGFSRATPALALLALFPALASVVVTQTQALWAVNRPGRTSVIAILNLAATITLLVLLTPRNAIVGPAVALLAGYLVSIALSGSALRSSLTRRLRATWPLRERFVLVAAYASGFGAAHATEQAISSTPAVPLCLLAGAVAYTAALLLCGGLNRRDRQRLTEVIDLIRSRIKRQGGQLASQPDSSRAADQINGQGPASALARSID